VSSVDKRMENNYYPGIAGIERNTMPENESKPLTTPPKKLSRNIINMEPELAERGRIKTGARGPSHPVRFEHFVITTMTRGKDGNFERDEALHELLTERGCGNPLTQIPVRLLFNERPGEASLNLATGYGVWEPKLKTWWCRGDGESAQRLDGQARRTWVTCPCYRNDPSYDSTAKDKCKIQGKLRVIIDGAQGLGGVWTYITTSWNSTRAIAASLAQLTMWTGGHVAGIPLWLVMRPKTVNVNGVAAPIQVVNLEYQGDVDQLRLAAFEATKLQVGYERELADLEKQIAHDEEIVPAEDAPEFYPDAAGSADALKQEEHHEPEKKDPPVQTEGVAVGTAEVKAPPVTGKPAAMAQVDDLFGKD
jgi:hypothetical protein